MSMPINPHSEPASRGRRYGRAARWLGIGLALSLLTGCLVDSKNPIAPPSAEAIDPDILGTWGTRGEDGAVFFHVFQPTGGVPGAVEVIAVGFEKDKSGSIDRYCGHLSRIGKQHFINLIGPVEDCAKTEGEPYFFVAYDRTPDGVLTIRLMLEDEIKKAIGSGKLAGEKDAAGGPTAHITADSAAIRAFILADTGSLWDKALAPLRRVVPPAN
jgi:hypothetical protein